ncbi:hypothetical protein CON22_25980 [Bacillus cereus]|nr:hypothetical protein CON22_25980 [Bacillus cereus]
MGTAKRKLDEIMAHERECEVCGETVWVNWGKSPNVNCTICEKDYLVVQCKNSTNAVHIVDDINDEIDCSECIEE